MKEREKASDLFKRTPGFFGKGSFSDVFPEVATVRVTVKEVGYMLHGGPRTHVYNEGAPPSEFVDCSNAPCYQGGFSVGSVLRSMVRNRETEASGSELCRGYEGSPKGRHKNRACLNSFEYKVVLSYKDAGQEAK